MLSTSRIYAKYRTQMRERWKETHNGSSFDIEIVPTISSKSIMVGNSCIAIPSSWEKSHLGKPRIRTPGFFLEWKGHATSGTQITPRRVKWLVTGSWESAKSWDLKFDSRSHHTDFQIRPTCYPRDRHARSCNLHPLALHRRSKQMCVH